MARRGDRKREPRRQYRLYLFCGTAVALIVGVEAAPAQVVGAPCVENAQCEFHFPFSDRERLNPAVLVGLSKETLWEARNEIFARKGYRFKTAEAHAHFSRKPYYAPRTTNVTLNATEKRNVELIQRFEEGAGRVTISPRSTPEHTAGEVSGLNPRGDGFLAVRYGPGSEFTQRDRLHNGSPVDILYRDGDWLQVSYRDGEGWVHGNWVREVPGLPAVALQNPPAARPTRDRPAQQQSITVVVVPADRSNSPISEQPFLVAEAAPLQQDRATPKKASAPRAAGASTTVAQTATSEGVRYSTSIRPAAPDLAPSARRSSERLQKVPFYLPGAEDVGEMWIEPTITEQGQLAYNMHFVDPGAEWNKISDTIRLTPDELERSNVALKKGGEWTAIAKREKVRNHTKTIDCFPDDDCTEGASGPSTAYLFRVSDDGSTSIQIQRVLGPYRKTYAFSDESSRLLSEVMDEIEVVAEKDYKAGTRTQEEVDKLFQ